MAQGLITWVLIAWYCAAVPVGGTRIPSSSRFATLSPSFPIQSNTTTEETPVEESSPNETTTSEETFEEGFSTLTGERMGRRCVSRPRRREPHLRKRHVEVGRSLPAFGQPSDHLYWNGLGTPRRC